MIGLLNILLEMEGFEVVKMLEDDLDLLFEMIRKEKPAVILMDVHLRQVNGLDLLRRIKSEEDMKESKVLMSSGIDFNEECSKAGADGFILKPYMPEVLIKQIRQMAV
jgi:DNA-binding NarL/FixJ family response regulator